MKLLFKLRTAFLLYIASTVFVFAADFDSEYGKGDAISSDIFVTDKIGSQVHLASLLKEAESGINVLFIFGGGDMGSGQPGHLWCQDSFEDTHILRTLYSKYQDKGVNFTVQNVHKYHSFRCWRSSVSFRNHPDENFLPRNIPYYRLWDCLLRLRPHIAT